MYFVIGFADRFLDIVGLLALLYLTVKGAIKYNNWRNGRGSTTADGDGPTSHKLGGLWQLFNHKSR